MKTHTTLLVLTLLATSCLSAGDAPDGAEILRRMDRNYEAGNRVFTSRMIVHGRRASRTIISKTWVRGDEASFSEYLAPAREKGIKMLKLEDRLWTYSPSADRTIRISGHMLRQSVMGSDLSYEDMMEENLLADSYQATVTGEIEENGRSCWVLTLTAKVTEVAFYKRVIHVDKERYVPLREERYAKSGKLLKTTEVKEVMQAGTRWVPKHIVFKDVLKKGKGTEFILDEAAYDVVIPEYLFTRAALRK